MGNLGSRLLIIKLASIGCKNNVDGLGEYSHADWY